MSRANQEAREARGPRGLGTEGRLIATGGRAGAQTGRPPARSPAYRLKRSIELFSASDGSLYLLRSGVGDDFALSEPSERDRVLLQRLSQGFTDEAGLEEALRQRGLAADRVGESLAQLEELGLIERSGGEQLLSSGQRQRYDRQLIYFADLARPGQPAEQLQGRLAEATVVLLGCGGLGSWTACGLACAGVGSLVLIDDDRVELSNLNRQLLFTEDDLGELKVEAAARALVANNSELRVVSVRRRVRGAADLADVLQGADLLIATADWPPYDLPRWVNQACLEARVPYVTAGQFLPLVRVGPLVVPGRSACLECMERRWHRDFPLYGELAAHRTASPPPAATLGAASGVVGSMLAMEAIHFLSAACSPAALDTALIVDLQTMTMSREEVRRDPSCRACGSLDASLAFGKS